MCHPSWQSTTSEYKHSRIFTLLKYIQAFIYDKKGKFENSLKIKAEKYIAKRYTGIWEPLLSRKEAEAKWRLDLCIDPDPDNPRWPKTEKNPFWSFTDLQEDGGKLLTHQQSQASFLSQGT